MANFISISKAINNFIIKLHINEGVIMLVAPVGRN